MNGRPRLAYAGARIQARISRLPSEGDWQRLASARSLSAYLEEARATGLSEWVRAFSGLSQAHELERGCRALARDAVRTTAGWAPPPWRAAIEWVGWLPSLALLEHLVRGEDVPEWMNRDDRLRALLGDSGGLDSNALRAAGLDELISDAAAPGMGIRWRAAWRARWPACGRQAGRDLDALAALVQRHLDAFRCVTPESAWGLRENLRDRVRIHLHLHVVQPVQLFAYLALVLLDLERLRAELLSRALFNSGRVC
jgi:hypothetical protein